MNAQKDLKNKMVNKYFVWRWHSKEKLCKILRVQYFEVVHHQIKYVLRNLRDLPGYFFCERQ